MTPDEQAAWDAFAAAALGGMNANPAWDETSWEKTYNQAAKAADAMLAERRKRFPFTAEPEKPAPNAADGWTKWDGGACPVRDEDTVELVRRDGAHIFATARFLRWQHYAWASDIILYRVVSP